nr:MAG TPA: hypothetical protein [Caudoviricetes sp.]
MTRLSSKHFQQRPSGRLFFLQEFIFLSNCC